METHMDHGADRRREIRLRKMTNALLTAPEQATNYALATRLDDIEASFRLVYDAYTEVGLEAAHEARIRFTKYHLLPSTKIVTAIYRPRLTEEPIDRSRINEGRRLVGTLTLIMDSSLGLPLEAVCPAQVNALRDKGGRLAEIVALAVEPEFRRSNVMMYLYKLGFAYARLKGVTDLCCAVTRHHIEFYRQVLLFEPMGELKPYELGNQMEVQGHVLNIKKGFERSRDMYSEDSFEANLHDFFFAAHPEPLANEGRPWTPEMLSHLLARRPDVLPQLDEQTLQRLRDEYARHGAVFPY